MSKTDSASRGIGFFGSLAICFITLKLLGKIDWPWWIILAPLWAPISLVLLVFFCIGLVWVIVMLVKIIIDRRRGW